MAAPIIELRVDAAKVGTLGAVGLLLPASIALPGDLLWEDVEWCPVTETEGRGITGAALRQSATMRGGRPVTLRSGPRNVWLDTTTKDAIRNTLVAGLTMAAEFPSGLVLDVKWRFSVRPSPFGCSPLAHLVPEPADMVWLVSLYFETVA